MRRTMFIVTLVGFLMTVPCRADSWSLVTSEEFETERSSPRIEESFATLDPKAPIIEIEQPDETKPIKSPVSIRIRFLPQDGAMIDLSTFKVTYGFISFDITRRIIEHAQLGRSGLVATDATIPSGRHRVTLQIADNLHRIGIRIIEFTVL
jgi:hypothetical protein